MGATSDDGDGRVCRERSGRQLGKKGTQEFLAVLMKQWAVSWYINNRTMGEGSLRRRNVE